MTFGLTGAPNTFLGAMNDTLAPVLRHCALVFFDDILIYSPTFESHLQHLSEVLTLLKQDHWKVKLSKCAFAQTTIAYLGHIISAQGVATDQLSCRLFSSGQPQQILRSYAVFSVWLVFTVNSYDISASLPNL